MKIISKDFNGELHSWTIWLVILDKQRHRHSPCYIIRFNRNEGGTGTGTLILIDEKNTSQFWPILITAKHLAHLQQHLGVLSVLNERGDHYGGQNWHDHPGQLLFGHEVVEQG